MSLRQRPSASPASDSKSNQDAKEVSTRADSPSESKQSLLSQYRSLMATHPLVGGCVQQAIVLGLANTIKQVAFTPEGTPFSARAVANAMIMGGITFAPILFLWFRWLNSRFQSVIIKTMVDQLIMSWVFCYYTQSVLAFLNMESFVFTQRHANLVMLGWLYWIPLKVLMFGFCPPHMQLPFNAIAALFYNIGMFIFMNR